MSWNFLETWFDEVIKIFGTSCDIKFFMRHKFLTTYEILEITDFHDFWNLWYSRNFDMTWNFHNSYKFFGGTIIKIFLWFMKSWHHEICESSKSWFDELSKFCCSNFSRHHDYKKFSVESCHESFHDVESCYKNFHDKTSSLQKNFHHNFRNMTWWRKIFL